MKKKVYTALLLAGILFIGTGCGDVDNTKTAKTIIGEEKDVLKEAVDKADEKKENKEKMTVFYGDEQAEFIIKKTVSVDEKTEEEIIRQLVEAGVLEDGVRVNECRTEKIEEKSVLKVDFSNEFGEQLGQMGTSGERMLMGSVVNTFLTAYGEEYMMLTVDGKVLESGHASYEKIQKLYKPGTEATLDFPVVKNGKEEFVEFSKIYNGLGFSICYDRKMFHYGEEEKTASFTPKKRSERSVMPSYLAVSVSQHNFEDTLDGLKTQADTDKVTETTITLGEDSLETVKLQFNNSTDAEYVTSYYVVENNKKVYIIETGIGGEDGDSYGATIEVMLSTFRIVD